MFSFDDVPFIYFVIVPSAFSDMSKKPLPNTTSWRFTLSPTKSFTVLALIQIVNPFGVNFCIWREVHLHPFVCGNPAVPTPFVWETIPFPLNGLGNSVRNQLICRPIIHCFDYYSFVVSLKTRKHESPNFALL